MIIGMPLINFWKHRYFFTKLSTKDIVLIKFSSMKFSNNNFYEGM